MLQRLARFDVIAGLIHTQPITPERIKQWRPLLLERPGIEPGAKRCISPSVDAIETPQRSNNHALTRRRLDL